MRRLVPVLLILLLHGVLTTPRALACSCLPFTAQERFERADAVFTGTATDVRASASGLTATLRVAAVYKGLVASEQEVSTEPNSGACGVAFAVGVEYTVFLESGSAVPTTTSCSGTAIGTDPVAEREPSQRYATPEASVDLAADPVPEDEPPGRSGPIAASLLLMVVTAGGLASRWLRARA